MLLHSSNNTPPPGQARPLSRVDVLPRSFCVDSVKRVQIETQGLDYIKDFLSQIKLPLVQMHEVVGTQEPCFYIRHDVDHSIERALAIAKIEQDHGFHSTFFLLPPGSYPGDAGLTNYYGTIDSSGYISHNINLADHCKRLKEMGHSIGFHNDLVSLSLLFGVDPSIILERELEWFDKHGITIDGTAAHGSFMARDLKFNNRELFSGCIRDGWVEGRSIELNGNSVQMHSLNLEDYGFKYEAYSLPRDSRISDSGGKWGGRIDSKRLPREDLLENFDLETFRNHIALANADSNIKAFSIMTHPIYWEPQFS